MVSINITKFSSGDFASLQHGCNICLFCGLKATHAIAGEPERGDEERCDHELDVLQM